MQQSLPQGIADHLKRQTDDIEINGNVFNIQNKNINTVALLRQLHYATFLPILGEPGRDLLSAFPLMLQRAYMGDLIASRMYPGARSIVHSKIRSLVRLGLINKNVRENNEPETYSLSSKGEVIARHLDGRIYTSNLDRDIRRTDLVLMSCSLMVGLTSLCTYVRGFEHSHGNEWYEITKKVDCISRYPEYKNFKQSSSYLLSIAAQLKPFVNPTCVEDIEYNISRLKRHLNLETVQDPSLA